MEQKVKFIIVGLGGFALLCLFLFVQTLSSKEALLRERDDLKKENTSLTSKLDKLQEDLTDNQYKINSLQGQVSQLTDERDDLQKRYEQANKTRE